MSSASVMIGDTAPIEHRGLPMGQTCWEPVANGASIGGTRLPHDLLESDQVYQSGTVFTGVSHLVAMSTVSAVVATGSLNLMLLTPMVMSVAATAILYADVMPGHQVGVSDFAPSLTADTRTATAPRSPEQKALLARIHEFGTLVAGWAGEDTVTITETTVAIATRIADAADRAGHVSPQASPSPEGEISLSWYRKRDRLALIVAPDGYVTWATSIGGRVEEGGVLTVESKSFPDSIIEALRGFYSQAAGTVPL